MTDVSLSLKANKTKRQEGNETTYCARVEAVKIIIQYLPWYHGTGTSINK